MMNEKEYGVKLNLDLSKFNANLQKAKQSITNLQKETQRKVKVTGIEGLKDVKVKVNTKDADKALEKLKSAKERIESGEIKITGLDSETQKMQFRNMQEVLEWQEKVKKMQGPQPIRPEAKQFYGYDKEITDAVFGDDKVQEANQNINEVRNSIGGLSSDIEQSSSKIGIFVQILNTSFKSTSNLLGGVSKAFKKITTPVTNAIKSVKKYAGALIGVYSAYRILTRAISSYMSFNSELQEKVQDTWAGLGSFFAPILEYLIGLFQKFLAYLNAVVKVFTGVDFIARANAKSMESQAKATAKANKALATFDELQNINQQQEAKQIELPSIDLGDTESFFENIKKRISEGDWYGIGELIGIKISDALNSINWDTIKSKTTAFASGIAEFFNGLIAGIDFSQITGTLSNALITIMSFLTTMIETMNWQQLGQKIVEAIKGIKFAEITKALAELLGSAFGGIIGLLSGVLKQTVIDIKNLLVKNFTDEKTGEATIGSILQGIINVMNNIGKWIMENIFLPFKRGFDEAFGIGGKGGLKGRGASKMGEDATHALFEGAKSRSDVDSKNLANTINRNTDTNMKQVNSKFGTWGDKIGLGFVFSMGQAFNKLMQFDLAGLMKPVFNGLIGLINKMVGKINSKLSINISSTIANVLKTLGVSISGGVFQLFSMPTIPALSIGTDLVKNEGLAYLHSGEKVVPADVAKGGYTGNNDETNSLLRELIETINDKDYKPYITVDDIGKASVKYIKNKSDVLGEALI